MVVLYCPACGKKILLKDVMPDQKVFEFRHCGHHITIKQADKKNRGGYYLYRLIVVLLVYPEFHQTEKLNSNSRTGDYVNLI